MKRVLFIQHSSLPGGAANALVDILSDINKSKYEPIVLCIADGYIVNKIRSLDVKVYIRKFITFPNFDYNYPHFDLKTFKRIVAFILFFPIINIHLYSIIKKEKIDLVYINSLISIACFAAPFIAGIPIVWHFREYPKMNSIGISIHNIVKRVTSKIICASNAIKNQINPIIQDSVIVYDWFDKNKFGLNRFENIDGIKRELKIPKDRICIGMVNQLYKEKGIYVFLETAQMLLKKGYKCYFVLVGHFTNKSDEKNFINLIQNNGLESNFLVAGFREDVEKYMALMDIVVSPNIKAEGFGKTIVEAGALGKPVIASNLPPAEELIIPGKTGILVNPESVEDLADSIEKLIQEQAKRITMGLNAKEYVSRLFDKTENISKIELYIKKAILMKGINQ